MGLASLQAAGHAPDELPWPDDAVEVGRVVDAFGIKGWLRVQPFSADPQALFSSRRWFVMPPERTVRPAGAPPLPRLLRVTQVKEQGDGIVAAVQEVADRTVAESLKGARLFVSRQSFPTPGADEYYWVDLIGLAVVNRQGEPLGTVADLVDTGPHCVLRLQTQQTGGEPVERLIPFVAAYIDEVDLAGRRIVADWGLDY